MSRGIVGQWLMTNMFSEDSAADEKVEDILNLLCDHWASAMHNRHFSHSDLCDKGMKIKLMEDDDDLQDKILTLHHAFMITFQKSSVAKAIESSNGARRIISASS